MSSSKAEAAGPFMSLIRSSGLTVPVLYADAARSAALARDYTYEVLPSTYLIDRQGKIRQLISGAQPEEAFRRAITESLRGQAARRR